MAVLAGDPTHLVGYSVITGKHLDWVYVKADYRKQGIARLLVPQWIETVTSDMTKIGKAIREAKQLSLKEEPFKSQEEMDATIATYKRLERHATLPDIMWCSEASARKLCKDAGLSQAQEDAFIEAHVIKENKEDE
jgi:GNAT superfamily N-acetyltransferase